MAASKEEEKKCFVIMPFSKTKKDHKKVYWTKFFEKYIKPSVEKVGYTCYRSTAGPGSIIEGILDDLFNADIALAVLTDMNPNVWYELGIRHSIRYGTIMIIEEGQKIPFDVSAYGVIEYKFNFKKPEDFREDFEKNLAGFLNRLERRKKLDNPVFDFLAKNPVSLARIAKSVKSSPLYFENALEIARQSILFADPDLQLFEGREKYKEKLFNILSQKGIAVKLLICDSKNYLIRAFTDLVDSNFKRNLNRASGEFLKWKKELTAKPDKYKGSLELKASKRIGNVSYVLVDPDSRKGRLLIRPIPWNSQPDFRPCVWISKKTHPEIFELYKGYYDSMWIDAHSIQL